MNRGLPRHLPGTKNMHTRTRNTFIATIVLAVVAVAAYWYWSPFLALKQMQSAVRAQDADAFNRHVDYPRLRDSVKSQMAARMAAELEKSGQAGGSLWRARIAARRRHGRQAGRRAGAA